MYCDVNDIKTDISEETLIDLTNDSRGAGSNTVDTTKVTAKIDEATEYINSYLFKRYPLPLSNTEDLKVLKGICVSLVVCELYQRRYPKDYFDNLSERRKLAVANLTKIQSGVMLLRTPTTANETKRPSSGSVSKRTRVFTDDMINQL